MDLSGIEPDTHPCHGCVLPIYYRPVLEQSSIFATDDKYFCYTQFYMTRNRAFTLIELLVVISVISLIASIVLASLNSAREKARIAGGLQFAANVYHVAGDQSLGTWNFDECSGTVTSDLSGNGNTGVLTNMIPTWSTNTPTNKGCSLSFDSVDDYVNIGDIALFDTTFSQFTACLWVKPSLNPTNSFPIGKMGGAGDRGWQIGFNTGATVNFDYFSAAGGTENQIVTTDSVPVGIWTHICASFTGSTAAKVYLNGLEKASLTSGVTSQLNGNNTALLTIGQRGSGAFFFPGFIDSVHIFAKNLTASEIGDLYASEALRFNVAGR